MVVNNIAARFQGVLSNLVLTFSQLVRANTISTAVHQVYIHCVVAVNG